MSQKFAIVDVVVTARYYVPVPNADVPKKVIEYLIKRKTQSTPDLIDMEEPECYDESFQWAMEDAQNELGEFADSIDVEKMKEIWNSIKTIDTNIGYDMEVKDKVTYSNKDYNPVTDITLKGFI